MNKVTPEDLRVAMSDPDFTITIDETTYKIGAHNFIYRWSPICGYWIRSTMTQDDLLRPLREKLQRMRKLNHE